MKNQFIGFQSHLLELEYFCFETFELLFTLFGLREDLVSGRAGFFQLPLVIFHLSLLVASRGKKKPCCIRTITFISSFEVVWLLRGKAFLPKWIHSTLNAFLVLIFIVKLHFLIFPPPSSLPEISHCKTSLHLSSLFLVANICTEELLTFVTKLMER